MRSRERFRFGKFTLDISNEVLARSGKRIPLRPQSFAVLAHLVRHPEQWVTLNDLVGPVFSSQTANANSFAQCIADIRKALGDPGMIRGIQRRGYMFAVPVAIEHEEPSGPSPRVEIENERAEAATAPVLPFSPEILAEGRPGDTPAASTFAWLWARRPVRIVPGMVGLAAIAAAVGLLALLLGPLRHAATSAPVPLLMAAEPSVAILAPIPRSDDLREVAQDFAKELTTELMRIPKGYDLLIASTVHTTVPIAKHVGSARYLVQGSLGADRGMRKYIIQLIEVPTGRQITAEPFEHAVDDPDAQTLAAIRLARMLAVQIRTTETLRPLPPRPTAGHYVIQGRAVLENARGPAERLQAKALFDKAIALEPDHLQGLTGYARVRVAMVLAGLKEPDQRQQLIAEATSAVDRILHRDPRAGHAHHLRGAIARANGDLDRAKASFEHALELNPSYSFAHGELARVYLDSGSPREALFHVQRALSLSPTDPTASFWYFWAGMASADLGDFPASIQWLSKALQNNPDKKEPLCWLAISYARAGQQDDAHRVVRECLEMKPNVTVARWRKSFALHDPKANAHRQNLGDTLRELGVPEN